MAAEERDRKKKGQKINRFDGSYHLDDDEPKGKRDFADGGSISGVNNYAKISKKPISKKSKRHNHADSEDNSDSFKSSESHKKHQHKHHSKAQNEQDKSTDTKVNQDPKLIKALNKKVNALKKSAPSCRPQSHSLGRHADAAAALYIRGLRDLRIGSQRWKDPERWRSARWPRSIADCHHVHCARGSGLQHR